MQTTKSNRSESIKTHLPMTLVFRILAAGLSYLIVTLTVDYLDIERYGLWVTLLSIMSWLAFFDVGIGNGLRNRLTEAIATKDHYLIRSYISTGYAFIVVIAVAFISIILVISPSISWQNVFNTLSIPNSELKIVIIVVSFSFAFHFILSLVNPLFYAHQKASLPALGLFIQNFAAAIILYILLIHGNGSLWSLGVGYGASLLIGYGSLTIYYFNRHPEVLPSLKYVNFKQVRNIGFLGLHFFIIQMAVLVIFTTDNLIITQILGPESVTPYNIVYKLFSLITIVHTIVVGVLWSAFTDAYVMKDIAWIQKTIRNLNLLMVPVILTAGGLALYAKKIISFWIKPDLELSNLLIYLMAVYVVVSSWNNIYGHFINGVGKIKLQAYLALIGGTVNIPLSIFFARNLGLGNSGVILGTITTLLIFSVAIPIQSRIIIRKMSEPVSENLYSKSRSDFALKT